MAVTILEALQNAHCNLIENGNMEIGRMIGKEQLNNAVTLLNKGYTLEDEVEPLLEQYGSVADVPYKTQHP